MPSKHEQIVKDVERWLRKVGRHMLQGAALDGCLALWRDFVEQTNLSRTRKPQTWAAALAYTYERMRFGDFSQEDIAAAFKVSTISVSQKYRQIANTLDLLLLDPRYLPEAMRAAVQRDSGPLPETLALTEAPTSYWGWQPPLESLEDVETWLGQRDHSTLRQAQDLVYDGWEAFEDPDEAERCFHKALLLDPTLADAHNGLATIAEEDEDLDLAQVHYQQAYELARDALGTESPQAYYWWSELDTRPYMRARQGLADVYWQSNRYREAITEYEALLALNPNDNQGVRYVIGPLYQLADDLKGALRAYTQYEKAFPDDMCDPHHTFCWGVALYEAGRQPEAVSKWRQGIFENVYIVPLLLQVRPPGKDIWLFTNLAWPDHAAEYVYLYHALWKRCPEALKCLHRLWHDEEMQAQRKRWLVLGQRLQALEGATHKRQSDVDTQWQKLIDERQAIEDRPPSQALLARVIGNDHA